MNRISKKWKEVSGETIKESAIELAKILLFAILETGGVLLLPWLASVSIVAFVAYVLLILLGMFVFVKWAVHKYGGDK